MGFDTTAKSPADLWVQYADQFPVRQRLIYLNHAAVSPLCRAAAEAMQWLAADSLECGSLHYGQWLETYEGLRRAAARLIGADRSEIALMKNTSEGVSTVANGIDWRAGDKIVAFREEFPSNYYPWKRLEATGVQVEWLSCLDPLDRIDQACRGARMLAISFVQYLSGHRVDLNAIGEICHRHGAFFFVDAIQGLGAFPLDVRRARIGALAADGHKWLLASEGCAILFVSQELQDSVRPMEFGWTNVAGYADYASRDMTLRSDAGRYECGSLNTIGCYGLRASIEFLLQVGIDAVAPAVQRLGDMVANGAEAKGYELLGRRTPASGAGIVSFRKPGIEAGAIVQRLKDAGITAAPRQGWVRVSPHFYISPDDIHRMLEVLP
ncbi:MAG: aminotransferase class V-fold PLP-dependent enzyme [Bryobacteraceae bacterium]|jgi:selenocysteine lyase/cysteine desulfurase